MKVIITEDGIHVEGPHDFDGRQPAIEWSCRHTALADCAWAVKRIGEEMEKSVQFYRTGEPTDNISID